jgi:ATP-dependent exoDNAse (exonuclease V) beta subunit
VTVQRLTGWELADPESARQALTQGPGLGATGLEDPRLAPDARTPTRTLTLTLEQEHAIARRSEPLLLAAGAGSGKTSVLVERFVRAVRDDGIAPARILAITFTERAAAELAERVRTRLIALGETTAAQALGDAYIGTFHGFCARVLRAHARETGRTQELEILDEGLAARLRRQAFADVLGEFVGGERVQRDEAIDLIAAYTADRARATVLGVYAELRSHGQRFPRLPEPRLDHALARQPQLSSPQELQAQRALDEQGARALVLWNELLARFGERFQDAKQARGGLDFDDLELLAGELLSCDADLRSGWAERFELLMVDELQDVNPRQLALVQALERDNLFTVGDEWQSIYGFRHADVGLFRARHAELAPRGQSLRLAHNFRGRPELLEAVNAVFAARFGEAFTPLRAGRRPSGINLRAHERETQAEPVIELLLTDRRGWNHEQAWAGGGGSADSGAVAWRQAEARALARRVGELVRDGQASPGGVAVLLRAVSDIECYEQALREQGLRTIASAGAFWARQEVADMLAYLRALADPLDELALYGALAAPPVGLSSDVLGLIARAAREQDRGVWELVCDHEVGGVRAAELCVWLEQERDLAPELELGALLERAIEHGGHRERLRTEEDGERRLANLGKLVELACEWERSEGRDLRGFLDEAAFQQGAGGGFLANAEAIAEPDAPITDADRDAVRLMSVHAAKGLEFEVVCVADLGRAPSMGMPDLLVEIGGWQDASDRRIGVRLVSLSDPEPHPTLDYAELAQERRDAQAEEEDRIVYVAMTRARERLLLSGAVDFASWPRERPGAPPIAWLGPALAPELPALCADAAHEPAPVLNVNGTDVSLRCRLNSPGTAA